MSNELETKLRGLINELQGLYRQGAADNAEMKRKISALEEDICIIKSEFSRMELELKGKTNANTHKIEALEENMNSTIGNIDALVQDYGDLKDRISSKR